MNPKSQLQFVKDRLLYDGEVSRNDCLFNFITRLGSRIWDLRKDGWEIADGEYRKTEHGRDYIYVLVKAPYKKVEISIINGQPIAQLL